jgi:hypothetical protein
MVELENYTGANVMLNFRELFSQPWFPEQYKNQSGSRTWIPVDSLALISNTAPSGERFQTITFHNNTNGEIDTRETRHGIHAGDMIMTSAAYMPFPSTAFLVLGIQRHTLTLVVKNPKTSKVYTFSDLALNKPPPGSCVLLSRHGAKFKVGDEVNVTRSKDNFRGTVRALNPLNDGEYLIDPHINETYISGPTSSLENAFWFPAKFKDRGISLTMCSEYELSHVNAATAADQVGNDATAPSESAEKPKDDAAIELKQSIRSTTKRAWDTLKGWMAKGELPVFDPRIPDRDGDMVYFGKTDPAPNLRECLRRFGASLFHALTGESEFTRERYLADPEESYGALMPPDERGALIRFLLFGGPKTVEDVEEKFPWLKDGNADTANKQTATPSVAQEEEEKATPRDVIQEALVKLIEAGLNDELAMKLLNNSKSAEQIIAFMRALPDQQSPSP